MSEDNTQDVTPALLSPGEAVIPADKAEEFKAVVDEILESKPVVADEENNVISSPKADKESKEKKPSLSSVADGVLGSSAADKKEKVVSAPKVDSSEKVALFSTRNVSWTGVGKVSTGYNIVTATEAEKWMTRSHIRLATPEEVAKGFNK